MEKAEFSVDDFKIATKKEAKLLKLISACEEAVVDNEIDTMVRRAIITAAETAVEEEKKGLNT